MKKITRILAAIAVSAFLLTACKKNDTKASTAQKIQGTWQVKSEIYNEHINGADHIDTTLGTSNTTIEFRNDGKVYSNFFGQKDTAAYTLVGDTQITIDSVNTYDIKTLTSNSLVLYTKELDGTDYYEETLSLMR
jgi:major membrane immunogen (membrane-anchored lipoprotein)